jgi:NADH dehydrogenase
MILVVGATGFLGREICRRLAAQGKQVKGMMRATSDPGAVDQLRSYGLDLVQGDLKERSSLDDACRGVETVISTATTTRSAQPSDSIPATDRQGQLNLVDAAKQAGVPHFLYMSYSRNLTTPVPLTEAKRAVEEHLKASGLDYTILRPSYYMEGWLGPAVGFDFANAAATIYGPGTNQICWVSLGDVAEFAVRSVDTPAARNAVIELGGPEALSPLDAVKIFEEVGGRPFKVQHVSVEDLQAQMAGAADPLQKSFAGLMLDYAKGDRIEMTDTLQKFPIQLTSVRDYAVRVTGAAVSPAAS